MAKYLLVDGYNIIFSHKKLTTLVKHSSLDHARVRLINQLSNFSGFTNEHIILVFDAYRVNKGIENVETKDNITIVYTKEKETADQYIERTSKELTKKYSVRVATSDFTEQIIILGQGAKIVSAKSFEVELETANKKIKETIEKAPIKKNLLMDNLDKEAIEFLNQLRLQIPKHENEVSKKEASKKNKK